MKDFKTKPLLEIPDYPITEAIAQAATTPQEYYGLNFTRFNVRFKPWTWPERRLPAIGSRAFVLMLNSFTGKSEFEVWNPQREVSVKAGSVISLCGASAGKQEAIRGDLVYFWTSAANARFRYEERRSNGRFGTGITHEWKDIKLFEKAEVSEAGDLDAVLDKGVFDELVRRYERRPHFRIPRSFWTIPTDNARLAWLALYLARRYQLRGFHEGETITTNEIMRTYRRTMPKGPSFEEIQKLVMNDFNALKECGVLADWSDTPDTEPHDWQYKPTIRFRVSDVFPRG